MSDESQEALYTATQGTVTVEAEYTLPGSDEQTTQQWMFEQRSPQQAKDVVMSKYIPYEATLWRIGLWYGSPDDRPDGGHEAGILEQEKTDE